MFCFKCCNTSFKCCNLFIIYILGNKLAIIPELTNLCRDNRKFCLLNILFKRLMLCKIITLRLLCVNSSSISCYLLLKCCKICSISLSVYKVLKVCFLALSTLNLCINSFINSAFCSCGSRLFILNSESIVAFNLLSSSSFCCNLSLILCFCCLSSCNLFIKGNCSSLSSNSIINSCMQIIVILELICNLLQCIISLWSCTNYISNSLSK